VIQGFIFRISWAALELIQGLIFTISWLVIELFFSIFMSYFGVFVLDYWIYSSSLNWKDCEGMPNMPLNF
jgi:hypothetical protein